MAAREEQPQLSGWEWFSARAHGRHAIAWLILLSFLEPIFVPIAPESLMVAMILAGPHYWKKYAAITTIASTLGGIVGYSVGAFLFREFGVFLLTRYGLHQWFHVVQHLLAGNVFFVMLFLMFSPIPDKVFIILAGFLHVPFLPYIAGFFLGRALRFGLVAWLVNRWGIHILNIVRRYFEILAALVIALVLYFLLHAFLFGGIL
ncbi:MAG: DedA family protein [Patescibacteria group bacterium]|nr:DedA family protein [Patescibacteria group bacterium]